MCWEQCGLILAFAQVGLSGRSTIRITIRFHQCLFVALKCLVLFMKYHWIATEDWKWLLFQQMKCWCDILYFEKGCCFGRYWWDGILVGVSPVHWVGSMTACGCYCGSICSLRKRRLFWGILMGYSRVLLQYIVRVCDSMRVVLWVAVWVVVLLWVA